MDHKQLLLQLIASLTLADHMGDVANSVTFVLKKLGYDWEWEEWYELRNHLGRAGITTLYGTEVGGDDDDDE